MIISINWLKKFTSIDVPLDDLTKLIGERLVEIEEVVDIADKYRDVVVVRVVECRPMEDSDHLNVTKVDDGGVVEDVDRDENGYVQVVCGANNVREGMLAAWLPPRSVVPETYHEEVPFVLGARRLRGYVSNGMLASARELDLYNEHEGILDIDKDARPGSRFADVYELSDYLLHIENKSLTHRPDTFGIIGFAREVAGIQGHQFSTPDWLMDLNPTYGQKQDEERTPKIIIEEPELAARYQAVVLGGADGSAASPIEIQTYLARVGIRPVSAVVDVTNYLMVLTGQPLHAFDYDKVVAVSGGSAEIHVRRGREGEKLELLDGRTIELASEDIVIAAGDTAIGLAGAMGGAGTGIDENTKTIILESATFNLYNLRSTQMRHGIFSEAITRFTKGQPAELTAPVLAEAIRLMDEWAGAYRVSDVADAYPLREVAQPITLTGTQVDVVLGARYTLDKISETLHHVGFETVMHDDRLTVKPPYWRTDIHTPEDVIEEIGRVNGYDSIAPALPARDFTAVRPNVFDELKAAVRKELARAGANEVLTYTFIHGDILKKAGQDPDNSYKIVNSISPDLQYYRQSLTPSLLGLVHANVKAGFDSFALFELNKVHDKASGNSDENVPAEHHNLGLVVAHKKQSPGAPYYQAKSMLQFLASRLGLEFAYEPLGGASTSPLSAPFEPKRAAIVSDKATGMPIGIAGEYTRPVSRSFKLPDYAAGFELDTEALLKAVKRISTSYTPLSRFPGIERDISFRVAAGVPYGDIIAAVTAALADSGLETGITPLDIYQPESGESKTVTIRVGLTPFDRTLTGADAAALMSKVADSVAEATGASVV